MLQNFKKGKISHSAAQLLKLKSKLLARTTTFIYIAILLEQLQHLSLSFADGVHRKTINNKAFDAAYNDMQIATGNCTRFKNYRPFLSRFSSKNIHPKL